MLSHVLHFLHFIHSLPLSYKDKSAWHLKKKISLHFLKGQNFMQPLIFFWEKVITFL